MLKAVPKMAPNKSVCLSVRYAAKFVRPRAEQLGYIFVQTYEYIFVFVRAEKSVFPFPDTGDFLQRFCSAMYCTEPSKNGNFHGIMFGSLCNASIYVQNNHL